MKRKKITIVIPAYNEEAIIKNTIETALSFLEGAFQDYELIIANDGSTDGTRQVVEEYNNQHLRCISHMPNKGKGCAVREGIISADGDIIVYTDADLAYGIEIIADFVKAIEDGDTDIAIGSRKLHPEGYSDYPAIRLIASRCFSFFTGLLAGFRYDTQCGLKAFSASAAKEIFLRCKTDGFAFDFEVMMIADRLSLKVTQLPVKIENHRNSKVKVLRDSMRMFEDIINIRKRLNVVSKGKYCDQEKNKLSEQ